MLFSEFIKKLQTAINSMGEKLTVDGDPGPKTKAALEKYNVELTISKIAVPENPPVIEKSDYFGAPWVSVDLDLLGRDETDPELNRRYVPTWAFLGLPSYKTLVGNTHAWCIQRIVKALRQVGIDVKGLTAAAASLSTFGKQCPFWFGSLLDIVHASGGRHACIFLYWIDESKKIAATLDGNRSNKFAVFSTDISGKGDKLKSGPRWPKDCPDGQLVSMAEVLKKYPHLKVGSTGGSTR